MCVSVCVRACACISKECVLDRGRRVLIYIGHCLWPKFAANFISLK